jgi:UrcA family protein
MSNYRSSLALAFAASSLLSVAALPVHAEDAQTATRMVQISDLDLQSAAGAAMLRHRVRIAARQVCGEPATLGSTEYRSYSLCIESAEQQALKTSEALIASVRTGTRYASAQPAN